MRFGNIIKLTFAALVLFSAATACEKFDPTDLENKIKDLQTRVSALESAVSNYNQEISAINKTIKALQESSYVIAVEETQDGYQFVFSDGSVAIVHNGKDGKDGKDGQDGAEGPQGPEGPKGESGQTPVIGVAEEGGVYFWTVNGAFLLDKDGKKVPVTGEKGDMPVVGVKEVDGVYYWTVNGEFLTDAKGNYVAASPKGAVEDSLFSNVKVTTTEVIFTLKDGSTFRVPLRAAAELKLSATKLYLSVGETKTVTVSTSGIDEIVICDRPEGWKAKLSGSTLTVTAPASLDNADADGYISILAVAGDRTLVAKLFVTTDPSRISFSNTSVFDTNVSIDLDSDFYGGIHIFESSKSMDYYAQLFLEDAMASLDGQGSGMYGCMNGSPSYSGKLSRFVNPSDGDGGKKAWDFRPGLTYVVAAIPKVSGKTSADYTVSDVMLETVSLAAPQKGGASSVHISKTQSDLSSVTATFVVNNTAKYYYKFVTKDVFDQSGMSVYEFALTYGNFFDLTIPNAGDGTIPQIVDYQQPETKCIAVAVAFDKNGSYSEASKEFSTEAIRYSEQSVAITGSTVTRFSEHSNEVKLAVTYGSKVKQMRYKILRDEEHAGYDKEQAFQDLMIGNRSGREEMTAGDTIEFYIDPEDTEKRHIYLIGIEDNGAITDIFKYEFKQ